MKLSEILYSLYVLCLLCTSKLHNHFQSLSTSFKFQMRGKLLIENECVRVYKKLHHANGGERWIWTRANSSTIRPQLKYWLWRILIQKYYVCFSLTFASTHEAKNFLSRFNKRTFSFHFCVELEFFSNRWNEISHWATRTPFYFNWFSWYFLIYFFFHCNSLNIKYAGNHQLKSLRSYACEKREERTANWSIN